jgi:peptidyl-prolyl cis-trans isomerase SurA
MIRKIFILSITLLVPCLGYGEEYKDRIIAVVNDKVILQSEVQNAIDNLTQDEITKEFSTLNERDIIKKVVDKLINESLLIQAAGRFGISISDIALEKNILDLAAKENLTINEFREKIIKSGIKYDVFVSEIRDKMTVEALFISQFYTRMNVTEEEVDNFIRRENIDEYGQLEFDLIELVIED